MPRILGVDIPKEKRVEIALTYLFGIGRYVALRILEEAGIPVGKRAKDLDDQEIATITHIIQEKYPAEGDLRRKQQADIKRLISIGCWRGQRHKKNLPVRGQRTRTNARTRKGPRKTIGAMKDKTARKAVSSSQESAAKK
ncbi:MAG TPA: 30S ribosomal protein S13 [Candidatus Omnitrophota bacterium]|nr:30S ribosomal protein S13 [Candidatus Omnitrophota bacterium]HPS20254.1 30S ribosomal protein S13 [Candidatus Omnitrophota bacterium]